MKSCLIALLVVGAGSMMLTPDNFDAETAGKVVLIKFLAPWWGHCKEMKPAWDKLMKNHNKGDRAKTALIADVDCTAEGKPLCEKYGIDGFPAIKWGDVSNMEDYEGERDYDSLKKWAKDNLKRLCSPANIDLCDEEKKKEIAALQALSRDDLNKKIEAIKAEMKATEDSFDKKMKEAENTYLQLEKEKKEALANMKKSGLGLMQAVAAAGKQDEADTKKRDEADKGKDVDAETAAELKDFQARKEIALQKRADAAKTKEDL